jgi:hypothetical protein
MTGYSVSESLDFHSINYPLSHSIPCEGKPPEGRRLPNESAQRFRTRAGHPLLCLKRDIHERLKVAETERGAITPFTGLILEGRECQVNGLSNAPRD